MRMRRALGPTLGLLVMLLPACAPDVPAGVDTVNISGVGTWSSPTFTITAQDSVDQGGLSSSPHPTQFSVTVTKDGAAVASFEMRAVSYYQAGVFTNARVGQFEAPDPSTPRVFEVKDAALPNGTYGPLLGSLTITELTYADTIFQGSLWINPVARLRATVALIFPAPIGLVSGTLSIG